MRKCSRESEDRDADRPVPAAALPPGRAGAKQRGKAKVDLGDGRDSSPESRVKGPWPALVKVVPQAKVTFAKVMPFFGPKELGSFDIACRGRLTIAELPGLVVGSRFIRLRAAVDGKVVRQPRTVGLQPLQVPVIFVRESLTLGIIEISKAEGLGGPRHSRLTNSVALCKVQCHTWFIVDNLNDVQLHEDTKHNEPQQWPGSTPLRGKAFSVGHGSDNGGSMAVVAWLRDGHSRPSTRPPGIPSP